MARQEIVLGTDSGTFWTGKTPEPWRDDPREAKVFASPREAWRAATDLQETQAEYLEGSHVELHVRNSDEPRLTRRVTSLAHANNRPALSAHWQQGFGQALPPDLPMPAEQNGVSRLGSAHETEKIVRLEPDAPQGSPPLPPFVRRHFVHTGDQFYYRQSPERLAFTVRGESFRAEDASVSVATALVDLAESRGWSALRVTGSKEFRRVVWATAAKRGLSVDGYSPSAGERAMLEQEPDPHAGPRGAEPAESRTSGRQRDRPADPLAGVLVGHGAAPYQHEQGNSPSYFVSLRGASGEVTTHWGLDLERAMGESGATVGDQVALARLGRQRVQVREPIRDAAGLVIDHATRETDRNAWSVTVREQGSADPAAVDSKGRGRLDTPDPIASKVVELFTAERLSRLPAEDRQRFQELYDQAKARLEARDRLQGTSMPTRGDHQDRDRVVQGR